MIKTLTLTSFFLVSLCNILLQADFSGSGTPSNTDTIEWNPYYRLQLDDFQGTPEKNSGHAAITATSLNYYFVYHGNSVSISTIAVFYKKESWLNKEMVDDYNYVLKHEQGHFDIAEVYARRLQVALNNYIATNAKGDMQNIYDEIVTEQKAMQQRYDKETRNSTNARKQREWNKRIYAMLNERDMD